MHCYLSDCKVDYPGVRIITFKNVDLLKTVFLKLNLNLKYLSQDSTSLVLLVTITIKSLIHTTKFKFNSKHHLHALNWVVEENPTLVSQIVNLWDFSSPGCALGGLLGLE